MSDQTLPSLGNCCSEPMTVNALMTQGAYEMLNWSRDIFRSNYKGLFTRELQRQWLFMGYMFSAGCTASAE